MTIRRECLREGIFSLGTEKKLENIFDREHEKKYITTLIRSRAWFSICGLRRTGKTTLIRSIAHSLEGFSTVYVNARELPEENTFDAFLERLKEEIATILWRSKLRNLASRISKLSFIGVSISLRDRAQVKLVTALGNVVKRKPLIIIIDEAPYILMYDRAHKFLSALHDRFAPEIVVALTGSVISLKHSLEKDETKPLYGRVEEELMLQQFDEVLSRRYLLEGFQQCGVDPPGILIETGARNLGGFAGWLTLYGRIIVRRIITGVEINASDILRELEDRARKVVYGEIAKFLRFKKNFRVYIRVLKKIAVEGESRLVEISSTINRDPSTTTFYLDQLVLHGIVRKINRRYIIPDPLVRRAIQRPEFEKEIKIRL